MAEMSEIMWLEDVRDKASGFATALDKGFEDPEFKAKPLESIRALIEEINRRIEALNEGT